MPEVKSAREIIRMIDVVQDQLAGIRYWANQLVDAMEESYDESDERSTSES